MEERDIKYQRLDGELRPVQIGNVAHIFSTRVDGHWEKTATESYGFPHP